MVLHRFISAATIDILCYNVYGSHEKMNFTLGYCKIFAYLFQAGCLYRHNRSDLTSKMIGISVMSNVIRLNCGTKNIKSGDQHGYHSAYIIWSWLT